MSVVSKYGVKVCLKHEFGEDHPSAFEYLRAKAGPAAIIALIEGKVHMAIDPSSFEVWFDAMKELDEFLETIRA